MSLELDLSSTIGSHASTPASASASGPAMSALGEVPSRQDSFSPKHPYQLGSGDNERLLGEHAEAGRHAGAVHESARAGGFQQMSSPPPEMRGMGLGSDGQGMQQPKSKKNWWKIAAVLAIIAAVFIVIVYAVTRQPDDDEHDAAPEDAAQCVLQCEGTVLQVVQFSGLFNDSKTFVDMPLLYDPSVILQDFNTMADYEKDSVDAFLQRNFAPVCSDMLLWSPPDYADEPAFVANISDPTFQQWGLDIHSLWNLLGRQMDPDVVRNPRRHTLLPLRSPHMIVPGGRFCEFYYWDTSVQMRTRNTSTWRSYWIIRGLLVSGMTDTARGIVENLLGMVEDYGFVPNGSRRYYLNRSQPPMLTLMVKDIFEATKDKAWLKRVLPTLDLEYSFWMSGNQRAITLEDEFGNSHILNRYWTDSVRPRPESYVADQETAWMLWQQLQNSSKEAYTPEVAHEHKLDHHVEFKGMVKQQLAEFQAEFQAEMADSMQQQQPQVKTTTNFASSASSGSLRTGMDARTTPTAPIPIPPHPMHDNETVIQTLYSELAAAAETGWDFSSRWFRDRNNLTSVETTEVIPVDLNAILYSVERNLADMWQMMGDQEKSDAYSVNATARMLAIDAMLWNATGHQWQDYHLGTGKWKEEVMISNFIPLWTKSYDTARVNEGAVVSALLQTGLVMEGGVACTLNNNTQQWDFPNAWAPLQWMIIEGLRTASYPSTGTPNFSLYNSTELEPDTPAPADACDVARPDSWYSCPPGRASDAECAWCFPPGPQISDSMGMRWLLTNYLAFNDTGYMLEKYYAPELGGSGAGGEYVLQKGFGWTNGVALELLQRYGQKGDFVLATQLEASYPYARMAPLAEVRGMEDGPVTPHPLSRPPTPAVFQKSVNLRAQTQVSTRWTENKLTVSKEERFVREEDGTVETGTGI